MKPETSNLASSWGLPSPIIKSHQNKKVCVSLGYGSSPEFCFFLNISTTAEASDFKFGTQLGFAKTHHKITPRGKVRVALLVLVIFRLQRILPPKMPFFIGQKMQISSKIL